MVCVCETENKCKMFFILKKLKMIWVRLWKESYQFCGQYYRGVNICNIVNKYSKECIVFKNYIYRESCIQNRTKLQIACVLKECK